LSLRERLSGTSRPPPYAEGVLLAETGTIAEWGVAIGTALLALATFVLARQARNESKVAAAHVVATQRPFVQPIVTEPWEVQGHRQSRIVLKNIGLGPAYNVSGGLYWLGGSGGGGGTASRALAPGDQIETSAGPASSTINWPAAKGYLRYTDSAGEEWQTHFVFNAVPDFGHIVKVLGFGTTRVLGEPRYNADEGWIR
jgi:hypothetical protein